MEIAKRAGYDAKGAERPGSLDFGDPKIVRAAERLFLQRAGSQFELAKLREDEQRYGRLLLERLTAATPLEPAAAETLGRTRGESVLAALVANGVDAARLRLAGPEETEAEKEGVPTTLTLSAGSD